MLFERYGVRSPDGYPRDLYESLATVAPAGRLQPTVVLLTAGAFNSAYSGTGSAAPRSRW